MQTIPSPSPRQIVRDAPLRVRLAWEALESAGFRIIGNGEERGRHIGVEFLPPATSCGSMSADNPNYEKIITRQVELARQCLKRVGLEVEPRPFGWRLVIWLPMSKKLNRRGRPLGTSPEEDAARAGKKLKDQGYTFSQIATRLAPKFGVRTPAAWQKLVRRYSVAHK